MSPLNRRQWLRQSACGFGHLALVSLLADETPASAADSGTNGPLAPKQPHFPARAKRVVFVFMKGGPSHVDSFDHKPELARRAGAPIGRGVFENLVKECDEEAGIPAELARQAKAVSCISYWNQSGPQLKPDLMTCFDLELPESFTPHANDGEVHAFDLWPVRRVFETVRDTFEFKYNCNLVLIDFFVRHGLLAADDPEFVPVVEGLRSSRPA